MTEFTPEPMPAPLPPPQPERPLPFQRPADYYASPERAKVVPRAVPFGCGTASIVFLVVLFSAGAFVSQGRGGAFMDALFGKMESEIDGDFTKDVPAAQRTAFHAEFTRLRAHLKSHRADFTKLQPLLRKITETTGDNKVTPDEAKQLTDALRDANR